MNDHRARGAGSRHEAQLTPRRRGGGGGTLGRWVIGAAVLGALGGAGCRARERSDVRVVVVTHGQASDPFWSVVKAGVDDAARELGVRVEYRAPPTFDMVAMAQLIDAAVASKPDGLAVSIPDPEALGRAIAGAVAVGIPVVSLNSGDDVSADLGALVHVGQTEYEAGLGAGRRLAAAGSSRALCINQEVGNVALDLRCQGFTEGFGGAVEVVAVSMDPVESKNRVVATLTRDARVDAALALGPVSCEPALAALKETGRTAVALACFDLSPAVLKAVDAGRIAFAIDQQQYLQGYLPVSLLALHARYGVSPTTPIRTGPGFVTRDNAAEVIAWSQRGVR